MENFVKKKKNEFRVNLRHKKLTDFFGEKRGFRPIGKQSAEVG